MLWSGGGTGDLTVMLPCFLWPSGVDFTVVWFGDKAFLSFIAFGVIERGPILHVCELSRGLSILSLSHYHCLLWGFQSQNSMKSWTWDTSLKDPSSPFPLTALKKLSSLPSALASPYFLWLPFASWSANTPRRACPEPPWQQTQPRQGCRPWCCLPPQCPLSQMFSSGAGQKCTTVVWDSAILP